MTRLFNEVSINYYFKLVDRNILSAIEKIQDYRILNDDLGELAEDIANSHKISSLNIDFENKKVDIQMVDVLGKNFPLSYDVRRRVNYACARVDYYFNILSGNIELLGARPQGTNFKYKIDVNPNSSSLMISYQTLYANESLSDNVKAEVKNEMRGIIAAMINTIDILNDEIEEFNSSLEEQVLAILEIEREKRGQQKELRDDLGEL